MIKKILKAGAGLDATNDDGLTPLMLCAINGNDRAAEALIQAGADVHAVCHQGRTALHCAAANNNAALVQLLLSAGASAAALCANYDGGMLALHYACCHGAKCNNVQMIKQLVSSGGPDLVDTCNKHPSGSSTALLMAINSGCSTEVAELLITSGADINATELLGKTSLMFTIEASVMRVLLEAGAAVNARNSFGSTVLHAAAQNGESAGVLCCLLKAGADSTATDSTGSTPAAVALLHGHTAAGTLLQRAESDQRSKQQQQLAAPLSADRQIG
jgi:uncharacterized protein